MRKKRNPEWVPSREGTDAELRLRLRLRDCIDRIGPRAASERFKVSEKTLKEWVRTGVSRRFQTAVEERLRTHERSVKSAATRKELARLTREKEEEELRKRRIGGDEPPDEPPGGGGDPSSIWVIPKKQREGEPPLTPEQMRPRIHPEFDPLWKRQRGSDYFNEEWHETGFEAEDSGADFGEQKWIMWGKQYVREDDDPNSTNFPYESFAQLLVNEAAKKRKKRTYWQVIVFVLRYIPHNPNYKGVARLEKKQGHWDSFYVSSTRVANDHDNVAQMIWKALHSNKVNEMGTYKPASVHEQAETRIVVPWGFLLRNVDRRMRETTTTTVDLDRRLSLVTPSSPGRHYRHNLRDAKGRFKKKPKKR